MNKKEITIIILVIILIIMNLSKEIGKELKKELVSNKQELILQQTNFPADFLGEFTATAYCLSDNRTATGIKVREGIIAVDPHKIPLHSLIYIENLGYFIAEDTGGDIKENRIDIFIPDCNKAIEFGVKKFNLWKMQNE